MSGLILARDLPSVTIAAMEQLRSSGAPKRIVKMMMNLLLKYYVPNFAPEDGGGTGSPSPGGEGRRLLPPRNLVVRRRPQSHLRRLHHQLPQPPLEAPTSAPEGV